MKRIRQKKGKGFRMKKGEPFFWEIIQVGQPPKNCKKGPTELRRSGKDDPGSIPKTWGPRLPERFSDRSFGVKT